MKLQREGVWVYYTHGHAVKNSGHTGTGALYRDPLWVVICSVPPHAMVVGSEGHCGWCRPHVGLQELE